MFGFSDLEERLLGEDGSEAFLEALGMVRGIRAELEAGIAQGLKSEDFEQSELLQAALNAAERILIDTTHLKEA